MVSYSEHAIVDGDRKLFYYRYGNSPRHVWLFHGFGQNHTAFDKLIHDLSPNFSVFAFDIYAHGKSNWPGDSPVTQQDWTRTVQSIIGRHGMESVSVVGYSLGARLALATTQVPGLSVEKLVLIAPEGLIANPWYSLATGRSLGRALFKYFMRNPGWLGLLSKLAGTLGLISGSLRHFVMTQVRQARIRDQIIQAWLTFRLLPGRRPEMKSRTLLIAGTKDNLFPARSIKKVKSRWPRIEAHIADSAHHTLLRHPEVLKSIRQFMSS
jgi:pimeloyl-ACP methyl ester carboxylesterase